ncbi:MAG: hypothetical protein HZA58_00135 [Acidimicrobiia bacterium]|nr:hypothetical protein [Acidimicrobiia bacterium]
MRRVMLLLALTTAVWPVTPATSQEAQPRPAITVTWSMTPRFGLDDDADGLTDFPNTTAYVHNRVSGCGPCPEPRFGVRLEASGTEGLPVAAYAWRLTGSGVGGVSELHELGPSLDVMLPEGQYLAEVRAMVPLPWGTAVIRGRGTFVVDDLLVVTIGDSYASGEGNPETRRLGPPAPARWGDGGDAAATAAHAAAHRSTVAWPVRLALALEAADPHTSVTFVSVAASGARIDHGILSPQSQTTPSQVDQVSALVGERPIDLFLVQEGGNSVGFARVVRALVEADPLFDPVCYELMVEQAFASVRDGDWSRGTRVQFELPFELSCVPAPGVGPRLPGLDGLAASLDRLADALDSFAVERVVLVGYPDPTGADSGGLRCREIVGDVTPPIRFHEISRDEGRRGVQEVVEPLNAELARAARAHGWIFVDGIASAFGQGHGYCAPWPDYGYPEDDAAAPGFATSLLDFPDAWYRNPGPAPGSDPMGDGAVSWYRTAAQSSVLQGPAAPFATSGTLHPNELGHAAIAALVLHSLGD